jgi:hypothetical protein
MTDWASNEMLRDAVAVVLPLAALLIIVALFRRRKSPPRNQGAVQALTTPERAATQAEPLLETETPDVIARKIETAIAAGQKTSLAQLHLDLARAHERQGNVDARMKALRSAAGYGALHGPPSVHAAARLALGEAAHGAGDLTSACEQWQMARSAFLEAGDAKQHDRVEKRMRENGCPTDWVLTDF